MKKIINVFTILCITVVILSISSCKKDDDNGNGNDSYPFSVELKDGYFRDYGYVVLHSLDGKQVIDYKKIVGDGIADFGKLNEDKVTVTTIRIESLKSGEYIRIYTDLSSPTGHWIFNGETSGDQTETKADITMNYPNENFQILMLSSTLGYNYSYSVNVPDDQTNREFKLTGFQSGDKLSIYGAVYTQQGGYYNWLPDQSFQPNITNYYSFEADKQIDNKFVSINKPIYNFGLSGFTKSRSGQNSFKLFKYNNYTEPFTNINVRYPFNLSLTDLLLLCSGNTSDGWFSYTNFINPSEPVPDNITIPGKSITAEYNSLNDEITNIQISGESDQTGAIWSYSVHDPDYLRVNWFVYAENDIPALKRPELPQEIMNDIGDKISLLKVTSILLTDYDLTSSHADIIKRFFIEDVPVYERYNEGFSYYYFLSDDKSHTHSTDYNDRHIYSNY